MRRYSSEEREQILSFAIENGVTSTVLQFGTNRNTIYRWLRRNRNRKPLLAYPGYHPNEEERETIIETARISERITLVEVRVLSGIKCSLPTIYRILSNADIPASEALLVEYYCSAPECDGHLSAVAVYYGVSYNPECPTCGRTLKRISSKFLPFYFPRKEDYLLRDRGLFEITDEVFREIEPLLDIPSVGVPVFIKNSGKNRNYRTHIVAKYVNEKPIAFCGAGTGTRYSWEVFNNLLRPTKAKELCRNCLPKAIDRYNKEQDLAPKFEIKQPTTRQRKLRLLRDTVVMKNVSLACKINGYSRPTYYSAKREFGEIA